MKTRSATALVLLAGIAIGGAVVQGLHAGAGPPVYVVTEVGNQRPGRLSERVPSRRPSLD